MTGSYILKEVRAMEELVTTTLIPLTNFSRPIIKPTLLWYNTGEDDSIG
jgi:hypothetical protein